MRFSGKIALITGSGRGIGRAIALQLASEGADVVVNFFRNRKPAEETAAEIEALGRRALVIKANVGEVDQIVKMFAEVKEAFGGLDILVCNAASGFIRPALEQDPRGWDWTMNINARSVLFCAQQAHPLMKARGGGYIVSISSLGSIRVMPEYIAIGASKAALEAITRPPNAAVLTAAQPALPDSRIGTVTTPANAAASSAGLALPSLVNLESTFDISSLSCQGCASCSHWLPPRRPMAVT